MRTTHLHQLVRMKKRKDSEHRMSDRKRTHYYNLTRTDGHKDLEVIPARSIRTKLFISS